MYHQSKKFRDAAYNELKEAKSDFPTFRVCVKNSSKRKIENKTTMEDICDDCIHLFSENCMR